MELYVLGSSSAGNCYVLDNKEEALVIEAGLPFRKVKEALMYDISRIKGVIVTHEHGDHAKYAHEYLNNRIDVYASSGTISGCVKLFNSSYKPTVIKAWDVVCIGGFKVQAFDVQHDAREPLGFMIYHEDMGVTLFATDTYYIKYRFENLSNILIECNYRSDILYNNIERGRLPEKLKNRTLKSHMSYETCLETLQANDLSKVNNIVLIHLSDGNSNEKEFKEGIEKALCKTVHIANKGLVLNFGKTPF